MNIAIDCETQGLDCTRFVIGTAVTQDYKTHRFYEKHKLWNWVLNQARQQRRNKSTLNIYSHNAAYDFYCYVPMSNKITLYSENPFIATYKEDGKEIINFYDTMALTRMSLKKAGEIIGRPKTEPPITHAEIEKMQFVPKKIKTDMMPYCENDSKICIDIVNKLKQKIDENDVHLRRIITINQVAINVVLQELKKTKEGINLFWRPKSNQTRETYHAKEIHQAYRGGRVEAFQTGSYNPTTMIDVNSLYPYAAIHMKFPDLTTERKLWRPLNNHTLKEALCKIGISRVLIENRTDKLGVLPIRTPKGSYYPKENSYLIGTYTNHELRYALEQGYKIHAIHWTVNYCEQENPLKPIMLKWYENKKQADNELDRYFAKSIMNCALGKFAQTRTKQKTILDSTEKAEWYLTHGYKVTGGIGTNWLYTLKSDQEAQSISKRKFDEKPYYTPIIPTLVNAYARTYMHEQYKKIPLDRLLYTDTDSITFKSGQLLSDSKIRRIWKIGKGLGEFKIEKRNVPTKIYGKKTYMVGKQVKISGMRHNWINAEDFEKGEIKSKKMITLKTATKKGEIGTFREETRNLIEQQEQYDEQMRLQSGEKLYIDTHLDEDTDLKYFLSYIREL